MDKKAWLGFSYCKGSKVFRKLVQKPILIRWKLLKVSWLLYHRKFLSLNIKNEYLHYKLSQKFSLNRNRTLKSFKKSAFKAITLSLIGTLWIEGTLSLKEDSYITFVFINVWPIEQIKVQYGCQSKNCLFSKHSERTL